MTERYNVIEILEQVQVIYSNGTKDIFETIHITDSSIHVGKIEIKPKKDLLSMDIRCNRNSEHSCFNAYEEFVENTHIPKENVNNIVNGIKRHVLQKLS